MFEGKQYTEKGLSSVTLSGDLPPPPSNGRLLQPTNHDLTGAQPCASTSNEGRSRAPTRSTSSRTLSGEVPPPPSGGQKALSTNHTRTGAQPRTQVEKYPTNTAPPCSIASEIINNAYANSGPPLCGSGQPLASSHHRNEKPIRKNPCPNSVEAQRCPTTRKTEDGEQPQNSRNTKFFFSDSSDKDHQEKDNSARDPGRRYGLRADQTPFYRERRLYTPQKKKN